MEEEWRRRRRRRAMDRVSVDRMVQCFSFLFSPSLSLSPVSNPRFCHSQALLLSPYLERLVQVPHGVRLDVGVLPAPAHRGDAGDELGERREQALDAHARHLHELAGDESCVE